MDSVRRAGRTGGAGGVRPVVLAVALMGLMGLVGGGVYAYRTIFWRQGEAAVRLIPAGVRAVVTVDTTPSPEQTPTFARIAAALRREGLIEKVDTLLAGPFPDSRVGKELLPHAGRSFAVALVRGEGGPAGEGAPPVTGGAAPGDSDEAEPDEWEEESAGDRPLMVVSTREPGKVRDVLARHGREERHNGAACRRLAEDAIHAAVIDGYLVLAADGELLAEVEAVSRGKAPAVDRVPEYVQARAALPADANLMVFVSPAGVAEMGEQGEGLGIAAPASARWLAYSVTLREQGLDIRGRAPIEASGPVKSLGTVAPVSDDLLGRLPGGAHGLLALSQPGKYYEALAAAIGADAENRREMEKALAGLERQTGIGMRRDVLPALAGTAVLAVYPDPRASGPGVDALLMLDDGGGADPAGLVEKVRAYLQREDLWPLVRERRGGAEIWRMREPIPELEGKSLAYALSGRAVIAASSLPLLDRVLALREGGAGAMDGDESLQGLRARLLPRPQSALLVDAGGLLRSLRPVVETGLEGNPYGLTAEDVTGILGPAGRGGIAASHSFDGSTAQMGCFVPVDYERLIRVLGAVAEPPAEGAGGA